MHITPWNRLQGLGLAAYARVVWRTSRYRVVGAEHLEQARTSGQPIIFPTWHGMTMVYGGYLMTRCGLDVVAIVPEDHRGAVLATWARRLGAQIYPVSMETNSLAAARRMIKLIAQMKQGKSLTLNPDGPDGPTHVPKEGVFYFARKANAIIVPGAGYTSTCYRRRRWDRYVVPFPFSRTTIVFGEPFQISPTDMEASRKVFVERLNEVEQAAERLHHEQ